MLRTIDLKKDYYKILGVSKTSKKKEIRSKYFEAAKKYHPDVTSKLNKEEQEIANNKFLLISQAYEILSNKTKRRLYDEERIKRNYNDPNEIKKDFYKNILRRAKKKGIDLDNFQTEQEAYNWWKEEQHKDRQYSLKQWRKKVKTKPMSNFQDYYYLDLMNKNVINFKQTLVIKNAFISIMIGIGIYTLFQYITSDTNLTFYEFYFQSPFLQQIINKVWYKKDIVTTIVDKNKKLLDDDGNWKYTEVNKQYNELYQHKVDNIHSIPPSLVRKETT